MTLAASRMPPKQWLDLAGPIQDGLESGPESSGQPVRLFLAGNLGGRSPLFST